VRIERSTSGGPDPRLGGVFPAGPVDGIAPVVVDGRRAVVTVRAGHDDCHRPDRHDDCHRPDRHDDCHRPDRHDDCPDGRLQVVDLQTGGLLRSVRGVGGRHLATLTLHGRAHALVADGWTSTARLVELSGGGVRHLAETRDVIGAVAAEPDRPIAVLGGLDGEIGLLDPTTGEARRINAGEPVRAVAVVAGVIAVGGSGVALFDLESGVRLGALAVDFEVRALTAFGDGHALAVLGRDGEAEAWDVRAGTRLLGPIAGAAAVAGVLTADGDRLLAVAAGDAVHLWDVDDRSPVGPPLTGLTAIGALCPCGPGTLVTASDSTGSIAVWHLDTAGPAAGSGPRTPGG
jgi:WD40 repeat protein